MIVYDCAKKLECFSEDFPKPKLVTPAELKQDGKKMDFSACPSDKLELIYSSLKVFHSGVTLIITKQKAACLA